MSCTAEINHREPIASNFLENFYTKTDASDSKNKLLNELTHYMQNQNLESAENLCSSLKAKIFRIDTLISTQLNEIIHHQSFKKLEATWKGLAYLTFNTRTNNHQQIRIFNIKKSELAKDLSLSVEFDQSTLFKKIYEEEFGTFGGTPYGMLIGDYYFNKSNHDIALLRNLSGIAASSHAPFISSIAPEFFDLDSFAELPNPKSLKRKLESSEYIAWRSFRQTEDARYVALTLPRVLLRLPYEPERNPIKEFEFKENIGCKDNSRYLWGNAAWALAERITHCFDQHGWVSAFRGIEGGGLIDKLPNHKTKSDDGNLSIQCPAEIAIIDQREKELAELGFIPLCYQKNSNQTAFFASSTTNESRKFDNHAATVNAFLSAQLPYIFSASRFAHYIKIIAREKVGSFNTLEDLQAYLNRWISRYVISGSASFSEKAKRPLSAANITTQEQAGNPGCYEAIAHIQPHLQLEELSTPIRLVANLSSKTKNSRH